MLRILFCRFYFLILVLLRVFYLTVCLTTGYLSPASYRFARDLASKVYRSTTSKGAAGKNKPGSGVPTDDVCVEIFHAIVILSLLFFFFPL